MAYAIFLQKTTKEKPQRLSDPCGYQKLKHYYMDMRLLLVG
ncbi:hypothetical protein [Clostridioides difficile]|nr:hypothetical protein [Clostridioides difficile]